MKNKRFTDEHFDFYTLLIVAIIILGLLGLNFLNEKKFNQDYYDAHYFDEKMADWNKKVTIQSFNDFKELSERERKSLLSEDERISKKKISVFKSYNNNDNQTLFLEDEINNIQSLDWEDLKQMDSFKRDFNYQKFILGKESVNRYLINHDLKLRSVMYSTDSALFTMIIINWLNSPLFFCLFFLLFLFHTFKKFEDGKIKFLFTLPISRTNILKQDLFLFIKKLVVLVSLILSFSMISSFAVSKTMTWDYPILISILGKTKIVPVYIYCIILLMAFFFVSIFIFFLTYMFLLLTKNSVAAILASLFICLTFNLGANNVTSPLQGVNPFSYVNVEKVVKGSDTGSQVELLSTNSIFEMDTAALFNFENGAYYMNDSLAQRTKTVDIGLLPIVLTLFSVILIFINIWLIKKYTI